MVIEHDTGDTPSWRALATRLSPLHPTGPEGFEGLVAGWLSHLLSEDFFVAASGRQRLGDAASRSLEVAIQTELYAGRSRPRTVEILGDVATLAANLRQLQVYVLASTADLDLNSYHEIDLACAKEGIDLVFLGLPRRSSTLEDGSWRLPCLTFDVYSAEDDPLNIGWMEMMVRALGA
jgi:hypothetical protein